MSRKHRQCSVGSISELYKQTVSQSSVTEHEVSTQIETCSDTYEGELQLSESMICFSEIFFCLKLHGQFLTKYYRRDAENT